MMASELIAKLAEGIGFVGDKEVEMVIQDHDGFVESNERSGPVTFVTDSTYRNCPFRIVSRRQIPPTVAPQVGEDAR